LFTKELEDLAGELASFSRTKVAYVIRGNGVFFGAGGMKVARKVSRKVIRILVRGNYSLLRSQDETYEVLLIHRERPTVPDEVSLRPHVEDFTKYREIGRWSAHSVVGGCLTAGRAQRGANGNGPAAYRLFFIHHDRYVIGVFPHCTGQHVSDTKIDSNAYDSRSLCRGNNSSCMGFIAICSAINDEIS